MAAATKSDKTREQLQEEAEERDRNPERPHDQAPFPGGKYYLEVGPVRNRQLVAVNANHEPIDEDGNVLEEAKEGSGEETVEVPPAASTP